MIHPLVQTTVQNPEVQWLVIHEKKKWITVSLEHSSHSPVQLFWFITLQSEYFGVLRLLIGQNKHLKASLFMSSFHSFLKNENIKNSRGQMSKHLRTQYTFFHRKYKPWQAYLLLGLSKGCLQTLERLEQSALRCHIMEGSKLYSCISKIGAEISHTPQQHNLLPHHSTARHICFGTP